MKIREKIILGEKDILPFLHVHKGDNVRVDSIDEFGRYHITYEHDCTEAEFNMNVLRALADSVKYYLTDEEKNAIDYAIGAIKTLADMGVLK